MKNVACPMPGEFDVPIPATKEERDLELRIWAAVRKDLVMPRGKLSNQSGHVYAGALWRADRAVANEYMSTPAQAKITLGVKDEAELVEMFELCRAAGLPTVIAKDQGRTVFNEKTYTMMAVGPCRSADLPKKFRRLQTLKDDIDLKATFESREDKLTQPG